MHISMGPIARKTDQLQSIHCNTADTFIFRSFEILVQALISVQALVFDLAQLTCQKRFDCRNAIMGSSAILLGTSYS